MFPLARLLSFGLIPLLIVSAGAKPTARLVKDINRTPGGTTRSVDGMCPSAHGVLFIASSIKTGQELWLSNGKGTRILKDICPGPLGSSPSLPVSYGGVAYFAANDGAHGSELWRSDGTVKGTRMVADLNPGPESSNPSPVFSADGKIFFNIPISGGGDDDDDLPLWSVGENGADPVLLNPLLGNPENPGQRAFTVSRFIEIGSVIHFISRNNELWQTDGSREGTVLVETFPFGKTLLVPTAETLGEDLLFLAWSDSQELWIRRGNGGGTEKLADVGQPIIFNPQFVRAGERLFFYSPNEDDSLGLWVTDGTTSGTRKLKDSPANALGAAPEPAAWRGDLYFPVGVTDGPGCQIWKTDGTLEGTLMVKQITDEVEAPIRGSFVATEKFAYYLEAGWGARVPKLWRTDGTAAGTIEIPGSPEAFYLVRPVAFGDALYYGVMEAEDTFLWRTLGTPRSTGQLLHPEKSTRSAFDIYGYAGTDDDRIVAVGENLLLVTKPGGDDIEIWRSDGSSRGTRAAWSSSSPSIHDGDANIQTAAALGSRVIFVANGLPEEGARHLLVSDGTAAGTKQLKDFSSDTSSISLHTFSGVANACYFSVYSAATSSVLWKTDGTTEGTVEVKDANGKSILAASNMVEMDGVLYFIALKSGTGYHLWRSDGTSAGTVAVRQLGSMSDPGAAHLMRVENRLSFFSGASSKYLWTSDGTTEGTNPIKELTGDRIACAQALGDKLLFAISNGFAEATWYASDGVVTEPYITIPVEVTSSAFSGTPRSSAVAGNNVFFEGNEAPADPNGEWVQQLWKTDGTAEGTSLLVARSSGAHSEGQSLELLPVGDEVYFSTTDGIHGYELWRSDGTVEGTAMAADVEPGPAGSHPMMLTRAGSKLYFHANRSRIGRELHVFPLPRHKAR